MVGLLKTLFGHGKRGQSQRKRYFSIVRALDSLRNRDDVRLGQKAGVVFHPTKSEFFCNLNSKLQYMPNMSVRNINNPYEIKDDTFGTRWVIANNSHWEELADTVHVIGETITQNGHGDRILAAVFQIDFEGKNAYWIYSLKHGNYSPFVPANGQLRDNDTEIRLGALMEEEQIPVERNLEQWYALWGIPF